MDVFSLRLKMDFCYVNLPKNLSSWIAEKKWIARHAFQPIWSRQMVNLRPKLHYEVVGRWFKNHPIFDSIYYRITVPNSFLCSEHDLNVSKCVYTQVSIMGMDDSVYFVSKWINVISPDWMRFMVHRSN